MPAAQSASARKAGASCGQLVPVASSSHVVSAPIDELAVSLLDGRAELEAGARCRRRPMAVRCGASSPAHVVDSADRRASFPRPGLPARARRAPPSHAIRTAANVVDGRRGDHGTLPAAAPHRVDDRVVARAAAEVAAQRMPDRLVVRLAVAREQVDRREDHRRACRSRTGARDARRTRAARGGARRRREPLDRRHLAAGGLEREQRCSSSRRGRRRGPCRRRTGSCRSRRALPSGRARRAGRGRAACAPRPRACAARR